MEVVLGLLDAFEEVDHVRPVAESPAEHLQAGLDPLEGVAALVRQAGRHLADGRQPLRLQGLPLSRLSTR